MNTKEFVGKVFLSHSSVDKRFVRRLAKRIEKEGFSIWLDERELVVGDPLGKKISEALDSAKVVLVVVPKASISSNWLAFELTKATTRMIKGECRVIPVVLDKVSLPPEVGGLLFADFTSSFDFGCRAIITALENEASALEKARRQEAINRSFWSRAELALKEIFGLTGYCSILGEYKSIDYKVVSVPVRSDDSEETDVVYDIVSNYGQEVQALGDGWWNEFTSFTHDVPEKLFLIVTERPLGFMYEPTDGYEPRISIKTIVGWQKKIEGYVVFADLSKLKWKEQISALKKAREVLTSLAREHGGLKP